MTSSVKFILKTNEIQTRNNRPNKNRNATNNSIIILTLAK